MALDPQIPLSSTQQPSFTQNMGQAFQLAGAYEKNQEMQQQKQDQQTIQGYLKEGGSFDTPDGLAAATEKLKGKVSLNTYQTLTQAHQESKLNEKKQIEALANADLAKLEVATKKNDMLIQTGKPVLDQYEKDLKDNSAKGAQEAQRIANENFQKNWQGQVQGVAPTGVFQPQELQQAGTWTPDALKNKLQSSQYFQKLTKEAADLRFTEQKTKTEAALERKYNREPAAGGGSGLSGVLERGGNVGMKNMAAAVAEAQEKHPWLTKEEVGIRSQQAKALSGSIADQTKKLGQLGGFERTAMANLDNLAEAVKKQREKNQVDLPAANAFLSAVKKVAGMPQNEAINLYGQEVAAELTKLASSANAAGAGGTLQDRQEWKTFFAPNSSFDQMMTSIGAARQSAKNRIESSQGQIADFEKQIEDLWRDPSEAPKETPKAAPKNTGKSTEVPRGAAPAGAIEKLKANPQLKEQFKAKYGYLPEGM